MRAQAPCIWRRGGAAPFLVSACAAACLLLAGAPAGGAESGAYHRPDGSPHHGVNHGPDGALASGGHAASENALPEVVITSSKRAQPLARFNGAAAVANEQALRDAGAGGTLALDKALPGLYTGYGANVMFPIFTVRGMTSAQDFYNPALTVYVDGVPQLPVMAAQSLAGAARVELLKGPQGTLYGQSALGGVLNVSTRTPGDAPYFSLLAGLSSRGGHVAQAEAAGPLSPGLLYGSAMVSKRSAPGDVSSAALAQSRLGGARDGLGRFRLRLAPQGQPWEASAWAARECTSGPQDVYVPFADIRPRQAYADARVAAPWRFFHIRRCANSVAAQGQRDWGSPGNGWRLTATASSQRLHFERGFPIGPYHSSQPEQWQQNTQEVRLSTLGGEAGDGAGRTRPWDAVFGLFRQRAQQQRASQFTMATVPVSMPATRSGNDRQSLAAYGDVSWRLTPRLDAGAGVRLSRDERRTRFAGGAGASAFAGAARQVQNTWQARLAAGWQFSPQWRGYVNVAQGYKPAGYNLAPSNPLDTQGFRRERALSYEAGVRLSTPRVQASFAIYRIRTRDVQLYTSEIGQQVLRNVGHARSSGVEAQAQWALSPRWQLGAGGFVNRATYTAYYAAGCTACAGKRVPHTPRAGLNATLTGRFQAGRHVLRPQIAARYVGAHWFDDANTLRQGGYTLLDASLAWQPAPTVQVRAWVSNLTGKTVRNYGFTFGGLPLAQLAAGRAAGVSVEFMY